MTKKEKSSTLETQIRTLISEGKKFEEYTADELKDLLELSRPAEFSYKPFSETEGWDLHTSNVIRISLESLQRNYIDNPKYQENNQTIKIAELGCGEGVAIKKTVELAKDLFGNTKIQIYAIDSSEAALKEAKQNLKSEENENIKISYILNSNENLDDVLKEKVQLINYLNSIHYVTEKEEMIRTIQKKLVPGGIFSFNSTFISESYDLEQVPKDTIKKYATLTIGLTRKLHKLKLLNRRKEDRNKNYGPNNRVEKEHYETIFSSIPEMEKIYCQLESVELFWTEVKEILKFKDFILGINNNKVDNRKIQELYQKNEIEITKPELEKIELLITRYCLEEVAEKVPGHETLIRKSLVGIYQTQ